MSYQFLTAYQWTRLTINLTKKQYETLIRHGSENKRVELIANGKITKRQDLIKMAQHILDKPHLVINQSAPFNCTFKITGHLKLVI